MNAIVIPATFSLVRHPGARADALRRINVVLGEAAGDSLLLKYSLEGDISRLIIPGPQLPRKADRLWQHTCFEIFVMTGDGRGYHEFNFSPSGEWAVYAFQDYREGGEREIELAPEIRVRTTLRRFELDARIHRSCLPSGRKVKIGLSAVVEDADGGLSYWALRHPPGKPDFHHADSFAAKILMIP